MSKKNTNFATDLIATSNPKLAKKLDKKRTKKRDQELDKPSNEKPNEKPNEKTAILHTTNYQRLNDELWRTVSVFNIFRYVLVVCMAGIFFIPVFAQNSGLFNHFAHPNLFIASLFVLLVSAVLFRVLANRQSIDFHLLIFLQLFLDVALVGVIVHATGGIESAFAALYIILVTTGSVILRRQYALALASATTIIMFYEHLYSALLTNEQATNYPMLSMFGMGLLIAAWLISYLAQRIRQAELKTFYLGEESIEEFLAREERHALRKALNQTQGNKTEAAELLGMSFRSLRYKLSKYEID